MTATMTPTLTARDITELQAELAEEMADRSPFEADYNDPIIVVASFGYAEVFPNGNVVAFRRIVGNVLKGDTDNGQ